MIKIILNGARGKMGKTIAELVEAEKDIEIVAGVDVVEEKGKFPIYDSIFKIEDRADVIVDFSNPEAINNLCEYALSHRIPLVVGTTGLEEHHKKMLQDASKTVPVFVSQNMSLGVFLTVMLAQQAARVLSDFDVEIVERHHNQKIDAPSGTALMLADAIREVRNEADYVYCRADRREKRKKSEIGIHSIRAGNLVGEHRVIFGGEDETIEITHVVTSRKVLAKGALKAARFIVTRAPGYYTMADLVKSLNT
ncbi:MAG: 4-hydroxy-tetrahydrodipicolinate reductase [Thermosediminibacteraceae bacterium]|nr:4-hydroxy-tetrahydrodipicolinate reductase [Thermosediminibacteraceae bacterium]